MKQRLTRALPEQAERFGRASTDGWCALVSAVRVSVPVAFAELRTRGFVEGSRGRYRLHPAGLEGALTGDGGGGRAAP